MLMMMRIILFMDTATLLKYSRVVENYPTKPKRSEGPGVLSFADLLKQHNLWCMAGPQGGCSLSSAIDKCGRSFSVDFLS